MVLKKSNSPFNSGATQKGITRGAYRIQGLMERSELMLTITLRNLPKVYYDKNNPSSEHAKVLDKVYDYLGLSGPDLKQFHEGVKFLNKTVNSVSISLNHQQLWNIPEKIDSLMKETHFLEGEENCAEILVHKVKHVACRSRIYRKESCVLNPKLEEDSKDDNSKKRKSGKKEGRKRGLQRPHLLLTTTTQRNQNDNMQDWRDLRGKKVVEVELQEEDHVDVRLLKGCTVVNAYWQKRETKSKTKHKSCVNGKKSYQFRAYNPPQLRKEIQSVLEDNEFFWLYEDTYIVSDEDIDIVDHCEEYRYDKLGEKPFEYNLVIPDGVSQSKKKNNKRGKREITMAQNEAHLVNVNTASSQTTIKHPKGSFQIIDRPVDDSYDTESAGTCEDDFIYLEIDDTLELDVNHSTSFHEKDISIQETPAVLNSFETYDSFVAIKNLKLPNDIQQAMTNTLLQSYSYNDMSVNDLTVKLGNCFPPVFCVSLPKGDVNVGNGWSLVGTAHTDIMSSNGDFKWEVTLKSTQTENNSDQVRGDFLNRLNLVKDCILQFHALVQMAQDAIRMASVDLVCEQTMPMPKKENNILIHNYRNTSEVLSREKAMERLKFDNKDKISNSEPVTTSRRLEIPSESIECDVCFNLCNKHGQKDTGIVTLLPCNHSFCYQCWLSHIFFHTTSGNTEISCMHTDCRELINETALTSFIPENYMAKLYSLRQERCIETSPLCQWCPQSTCNKVAMIAEESLHLQQFGSCVVCDCKKSFCFSCQANPHWPLSCEQAAAYRKLLYKLGDGGMAVELTFTVDLKPCPKCKYPIEKSEGCHHMTCRMCRFTFCWKCLRSAKVHRTWDCLRNEYGHFRKYELHNDVVSTFPLKFLTDSFEMRKRFKSIKKFNIHRWINGLNHLDYKKIKIPFGSPLSVKEAMLVKSRVASLATDSVSFLIDSYSFLEYFYILFAFALLNKEKEDGRAFLIFNKRVIDRLVFTTLRLEDLVIENSHLRLFNSEKKGLMYLSNGQEMLSILKSRVTSVQRRSKDVDAKYIGDLDPRNYIRYK